MRNIRLRQPSTWEDVQPLLAETLRRLQGRFGEELVSVVVYGSYARGNAHAYSDLDVLVVLKNVPRDWDAIFELEHEVGCMGRGLGKKVQGQVLSPSDVTESVQSAAPMMLEVFDAHRILVDRDRFFARQMRDFAALMRKRDIRKLKQGVWK